MIATEAALYGSSAGGATATAPSITTLVVCGCGQEIGGLRREHCPRCGCCLT